MTVSACLLLPPEYESDPSRVSREFHLVFTCHWLPLTRLATVRLPGIHDVRKENTKDRS